MPALLKVARATNLSLNEVLEMKHDVFLASLKCEVIRELNETEEGRKYLEDCKRLNTTSLDKNAFRRVKAKLSK